jgi:rubrerythrin
MQTTGRAQMIEGLNIFRALEAWGAKLYAAWAAEEEDDHLRAGHLIIAEREANHARLLGEHLRALGAEPGSTCVDQVLARQLEELRGVRGFLAQLDALKAANERDAAVLAGCQEALARGFEAAKQEDPATHGFWATLYSEEKVSGGWYRAKYGELSGRRPRTADLPVLEPGQVSRRAESATFTAEAMPASGVAG